MTQMVRILGEGFMIDATFLRHWLVDAMMVGRNVLIMDWAESTILYNLLRSCEFDLLHPDTM